MISGLLDTYAVQAVVDLRHAEWQVRLPNDFTGDPRTIFHRADAYCRHLALRPEAEINATDVVIGAYSGLCVYMISRYGYNYIEVARIAAKGVADVVASISGDPRLDIPRQRREMIARMDSAGLVGQVVRLAEIATVGKQLVALSADEEWLRGGSGWGGPNAYELENWTQYAYSVVSAMKHGLFVMLEGRMRFERALQSVMGDLDLLHTRTRIRKQAKKPRSAVVAEGDARVA